MDGGINDWILNAFKIGKQKVNLLFFIQQNVLNSILNL